MTTASAFASSGGPNDPRFDQNLEQNIKGGTRGNTNTYRAATLFTRLGNGAPGVALIGTGYLIGRWSGNERLADASSLSAEALLSSGLWVTGLKQILARTRPSGGGTGAFFQYHPDAGQQKGSFPSGHAIGAFTIATVFAEEYSDKKWVPWVMYGTAGAIALSRVSLGRHYTTDVIAGAILGNSIGRMVVARQAESGGLNRRPLALSNFEPILDPAKRVYGLGYSYSW